MIFSVKLSVTSCRGKDCKAFTAFKGVIRDITGSAGDLYQQQFRRVSKSTASDVVAAGRKNYMLSRNTGEGFLFNVSKHCGQRECRQGTEVSLNFQECAASCAVPVHSSQCGDENSRSATCCFMSEIVISLL